MALKSVAAYDALAAALTNVSGLPAALTINDKRLVEFADSGVAGLRWRLVLITEHPEVGDVEMGDPPQWELLCPATVLFMLEGEAGDPRDDKWAAALEILAGVLFPSGRGFVVDGVIEDTQLRDVTLHHAQAEDTARPVEVLEIDLMLSITAPTPFG